MKSNLSIRLLFLYSLAFLIFACQKFVSLEPSVLQSPPKSQQSQTKSDSIRLIPFPQSGVIGCSYAPNYGDTILYTQPTNGTDYIISPLNNPGSGTYFSWPQGMVIDSLTGKIDMTKSETGQRYDIGFVKSGTKDTCLQSIILAGTSYIDSVYVLGNSSYNCIPYFNANPSLVSVCGNTGPSCQFDITGQANAQKIRVDLNTGVMDLQKTLQDGAFGLLPIDGQTVTTTIYYRLNDASNYALQHIDVTFIYYTSKSLIPGNILNSIVTKRANILQDLLISNSKNPRPPVIIITRFK